MENVIDIIVSGISQCWTIMQNFEFLGTNMLKFCITLFIISSFIPILLTLLRNGGIDANATYREGITKHREEMRDINKKLDDWQW